MIVDVRSNLTPKDFEFYFTEFSFPITASIYHFWYLYQLRIIPNYQNERVNTGMFFISIFYRLTFQNILFYEFILHVPWRWNQVIFT